VVAATPRLRAIAAAIGGPWHPTGRGVMVRCPAHDDRDPSLHLGEAADGRLLVRCFAGCSQGDVIAALEARGLWPGRSERLPARRAALRPDGAGKADVDPPRMALGAIAGGAVRLGPAAAEIAVAEGIETGLAVAQATGLPVWAALSTGGLRSLILPPEVRTVLVFSDGDAPGEAAARAAASRWLREGCRVRIARPPSGMDANDLLRAGPHER
jgi:hypothetical protein